MLCCNLKDCCTKISQRWIFGLMAFLALCFGNSCRSALSIAITEMTVPILEPDDLTNADDTCEKFQSHELKNSTRDQSALYQWDEYTQGIILSSFYWSYVPAQLFHGWLSERFGGKYFLGLGIFMPSILTLLTPQLIEIGDSRALIISRVLSGLFNSSMYPACSTMICRWTSPGERAKLGSFVYTGAILGLVLGSVLPAVAIRYSASGWPAAFYYSGALGVIWFPVWVLLCYNDPTQHPFISRAELAHLQVSKEKEEVSLPPAPYRHILTSKAFSAYVVGLIGSDWMFFLMSIDLPKYMSNIVRLPIEYNGYLTSLSFTSMWISTIVSTWISDLLLAKQIVSLVNVRKLLGVISLMGSAIFVLGASYAECNQALVVAMFVMGTTLMGTSNPSIVVNHLDLSPNYAGSLSALGNGVTSLNGILAPYIVGWLTPRQTICEWRLVFWIGFGIATLSSAYYIIFASGDVQDWNEPNFKRNRNRRKKEVIDLSDC